MQMEVSGQVQQSSNLLLSQEREKQQPANQKRPLPVPTSQDHQQPTNQHRRSADLLPGSPVAETVNRKRRAIFGRVFSSTYLPQNSIAHKR